MTLREFLRRQADGAYRSPAKNVQARAGWCTYESDPDTLPEKLKQAARVLSHKPVKPLALAMGIKERVPVS